MSAFVTRFAPSPTGYLHRGHAYSALTAFAAAREASGRFILRIEDIDATRCRPEYETAIYEDLAWLGLAWETPVRRQSDHMADYRAALDGLIGRGLAYRCFRTRREVIDAMASAPHGPLEAFLGAALPSGEEMRRLEAGEPYAWRLSLAAAREALGAAWDELNFVDEIAGRTRARPELAGDIVLARKDVGVAYHLAVVHDDALRAITHIIRGEDLFEATHVHRLLQALLDLPAPGYRHHRLLTDASGRKFSKRDQAPSLGALRESGKSPADIREMIKA